MKFVIIGCEAGANNAHIQKLHIGNGIIFRNGKYSERTQPYDTCCRHNREYRK